MECGQIAGKNPSPGAAFDGMPGEDAGKWLLGTNWIRRF
jgi:hypothetical protein